MNEDQAKTYMRISKHKRCTLRKIEEERERLKKKE